MGLVEELARLGKTLLTMDAQVEHLSELLGGIRRDVGAVVEDMVDLRERVAHLEAFRDADRAQMQAELSRFSAEVERAELRLARMLPGQLEVQPLPDGEQKGS